MTTAHSPVRPKPLIGDGTGRYRILIVGNSGALLPRTYEKQNERAFSLSVCTVIVVCHAGAGKVRCRVVGKTRLLDLQLEPNPRAMADDIGR